MSNLNTAQYEQLLKPISASRVKTLDNMSHMEAWDVRRHLIRIFGFGGFSADMTDLSLLYEFETQTKAGKPAYRVAYRATMRLEIPQLGCTYTEAAVGESTMPDFKRGDCHDMAIKTAASQAFKRAAMNLGTQFGLSLYDEGNRDDVVGRTLCPPDGFVAPQKPTQVVTDTEESQDAYALDGAEDANWLHAVASATDELSLKELWDSATESGVINVQTSAGVPLREVIGRRVLEMREANGS